MQAVAYRVALIALAVSSIAASHRTPNFVVSADSDQVAQAVAQQAERFRTELAVEWTGQAIPNWSQPCPIRVTVGEQLGAGGATSFVFNDGEVFGWQMNIQGPLDRVLDSVLPHEVTHTIFATHFRRPLPRWADEGACSTVEHDSERIKQQKLLIAFLRTGRGIPFSQMFAMREYPKDILPLYAQGHSLASYLVGQGGKQKYLAYLAEGMRDDQWVDVTARYYGYANLGVLQNSWLEWVRRGSPPLRPAPENGSLVQGGRPRPEPNLIVRAQSADPQPPAHGSRTTALPTPGPDSDGWVAATRRPQSAVPVTSPAPMPAIAAQPPTANPRKVLLEWSRSGTQPTPDQASVYDTGIAQRDTLLR